MPRVRVANFVNLAILIFAGHLCACAAPDATSLAGASTKKRRKVEVTESAGSAPNATTTVPSETGAKPSSPSGTSTSASSGASGTQSNTAPAGSCVNPRCACDAWGCGCSGSDNGSPTSLGCEDGVCGCFVGFTLVTDFDAACETPDDARQLFLGQCDCR